LPCKMVVGLAITFQWLFSEIKLSTGAQVFNRERTLTGRLPWNRHRFSRKAGGKVYYKIRTNATLRRHFRESAEEGTIAVRYAVMSK